VSNNRSGFVIQPVRFVDAYYDFTPVQRDFIMLIHQLTNDRSHIKNTFTIDLKPYFKTKGLDIKDIRFKHYSDLCEDLLNSKVSFKYFSRNTLYSHHNLFSRCSINQDFILEVEIIDDVLPLFYLNKLEHGHFKDNRLIKTLFAQSLQEHDHYVAYLPKTYIDFGEKSVKKLFEKLLQYRMLGDYTYDFGKGELYFLLGYGYFKDKTPETGQISVFEIIEQEFIETRYKGTEGWKNLRGYLNKWLAEISNHEKSGITIVKQGKNYFKTQGRPIRNIFIKVIYDKFLGSLSEDQKKIYNFLKTYELSEKQILRIISDFPLKDIKKRVHEYVVKKSDHKGDSYYGEFKRSDHRKIGNVPGYIYGVVFQYGLKY